MSHGPLGGGGNFWRRRGFVVSLVVGVTLGLALGYVATEFDLRITNDVGTQPYLSGVGFALLAVLGIVGLASLIWAGRDSRARRARQHRSDGSDR